YRWNCGLCGVAVNTENKERHRRTKKHRGRQFRHQLRLLAASLPPPPSPVALAELPGPSPNLHPLSPLQSISGEEEYDDLDEWSDMEENDEGFVEPAAELGLNALEELYIEEDDDIQSVTDDGTLEFTTSGCCSCCWRTWM
ncbi:hypothetical protein HK098_001678, partial [Nowakowskiella sp. JEL0407]